MRRFHRWWSRNCDAAIFWFLIGVVGVSIAHGWLVTQ